MNDLEKVQGTFSEESRELISELEEALLELEKSPGDQELIAKAFRALHTIKGTSAMLGFDDASRFAHEMEHVFDGVRNGSIPITKDLLDHTFSAVDHIRLMLCELIRAENLPGLAELTESFRNILRQDDLKENVLLTGENDGIGVMTLYRICFHPDQTLFERAINPGRLLNELRELGRCEVIVQTDAVPGLKKIDPEKCYLSWDIILMTDKGMKNIRQVFLFVENEGDLNITAVTEVDSLCEEDVKKVGEILVERGDISTEAIERVLNEKQGKRIGELLTAQGLLTSGKVEAALTEQDQIKEMLRTRRMEEQGSSIRISLARLDRLVNLVGELVTVQARLSQTVSLLKDPELVLIAEVVERLTDELRDNAMNIRMVPIGTTFSKFKRLVRDLSGKLGKDIELRTKGADTELDKTVIEKLTDPLVHIIRNSIDHGIEQPETRREAGKPKVGTIHLGAEHSGAHVLIHVTDDGSGIDPEMVRQKALEKGLIVKDADMPDNEIISLIFAPGFSTAKNVTGVSGRGVGMDVVKRAIEPLGGDIEIKSQKGAGTKITLKLPLTLAIIDGLLVKVGDGSYVFPLSLVEECVEFTAEDRSRAHGRHLVNVRNEIVPYIHLRELLYVDGDRPSLEQIVITRAANRKVGFVVDYVIGEHQTVIKSLGRMFRNIDGVSGATILGDGTVALILDVQKLMFYGEQDN